MYAAETNVLWKLAMLPCSAGQPRSVDASQRRSQHPHLRVWLRVVGTSYPKTTLPYKRGRICGAPRGFARTRLKMITSFWQPWKASTDETCTASRAPAGRALRCRKQAEQLWLRRCECRPPGQVASTSHSTRLCRVGADHPHLIALQTSYLRITEPSRSPAAPHLHHLPRRQGVFGAHGPGSTSQAAPKTKR